MSSGDRKDLDEHELETINNGSRITIAEYIDSIDICPGTCLSCGLETALDVR